MPGGRIRKSETIENAFQRLIIDEIGIVVDFSCVKFVGVYQHFYHDNYRDNLCGTHYIVLAYEVLLEGVFQPPNVQHSEYIWIAENDILTRDDVHSYTKGYITPNF